MSDDLGDIIQEQARLTKRLRILKKCVELTEARLLEINRPKHLDAAVILAEMRERELARRPKQKELWIDPCKVDGVFVGDFL